MAKENKNNKKKITKTSNFEFSQKKNPFPQEYTYILGSKSGVLFHRKYSVWNFFLPYGPMLTKTKRKLTKIQNLKFHNSLDNFGTRQSLGVSMFFGECQSDVYFQRRCHLKVLLQYGPKNYKMMKTTKRILKKRMVKKWRTKENFIIPSEDTVVFPKFGINLLGSCWENELRMDACVTTAALLCSNCSTKHS